MGKPTASELQLQIHARMVEELSQQQRDFSTLINLLEEIVFRCDSQGTIQMLNPSWVGKLGYPIEQCLGRSLLDYVSGEYARESLRQAFTEGEPISQEIRLRSGFGERRSFILRASRNGDNWYGSLFDITDQQLALQALRDSESRSRKLSLVARRTDNLVVITDASCRIEWVNEGFERRTGYALRDVKGYSPGQFLQGPDTDPATVAEMRAALQRGQGFTVDIVNYDKQNQPYWVRIDSNPLHDEQGRLQGFIAIERDITQAKQTEQMLCETRDEAQRLSRARTRFVANMSHEIRTPLNAILGMSELLEESELPPEQRSHVETIRNSGKALLALVNDVLDFAKLESGQLPFAQTDFPTSQPFEEAVDIITPQLREKRLALRMSCAPGVPAQLGGDPDRLRQVVLNLLSNALKFTRQGQIRIHVGWRPGEAGHGLLQVSIADTGIGIDPGRLDSLFDEFTQADASITREFGGTGLGLAICRQICEQSGGRIWAESEPGVGSQFHFEMGLRALRAAEPGPPWELVHDKLPRDVTAVIEALGHCLLLPVSAKPGLAQDGTFAVRDVSGRYQEVDLAPLHDVLTPQRIYQRAAAALGQTEPAEKSARGGEGAGAGLRILVAEDVPPNQLVLKLMLQRMGCQHIRVVDDGAQAVAAFADEEFDLVLTDMHMPVMDGLQAATQIRRMAKIRQPVIAAISADATNDAREAAREAGIDHWLSKPVNRGELERLLREVASDLAGGPPAAAVI